MQKAYVFILLLLCACASKSEDTSKDFYKLSPLYKEGKYKEFNKEYSKRMCHAKANEFDLKTCECADEKLSSILTENETQDFADVYYDHLKKYKNISEASKNPNYKAMIGLLKSNPGLLTKTIQVQRACQVEKGFKKTDLSKIIMDKWESNCIKQGELKEWCACVKEDMLKTTTKTEWNYIYDNLTKIGLETQKKDSKVVLKEAIDNNSIYITKYSKSAAKCYSKTNSLLKETTYKECLSNGSKDVYCKCLSERVVSIIKVYDFKLLMKFERDIETEVENNRVVDLYEKAATYCSKKHQTEIITEELIELNQGK